MDKRNIFVLGNDSFNDARLKEADQNNECEFHWLLDYDYIHSFRQNPMSEIMDTARRQLKQFPGTIDAMVWLWDFPGCLMGPILCKEFGLISPSPTSVFKCENKYLSRIEQQKVIPECVPKFEGFNPDENNIVDHVQLSYPFWIKPATGFSGHLGYKIASEQDFKQALSAIKAKKDLFAEPYSYLEKQIEIKSAQEQFADKMFIAEQIISGKQCTLEGFVSNGTVGFHGIIDSFRYRNRMSFARYQYPSQLPRRIKLRLYDKAEKIIHQSGYNNGAFNIEFFYERKKDKIWLLEINTRISQSHCELFRKVDGQLSHKIILDIALGRQPGLPRRQGRYKVAGKLFLRSFADGTVTKSPDQNKIEQLQRQFQATIQVGVHEGMKLSHLKWQDSYSFVLVLAYMGARSTKELLSKFDQCADKLDIEVDGRKIQSKQGRAI